MGEYGNKKTARTKYYTYWPSRLPSKTLVVRQRSVLNAQTQNIILYSQTPCLLFFYQMAINAYCHVMVPYLSYIPALAHCTGVSIIIDEYDATFPSMPPYAIGFSFLPDTGEVYIISITYTPNMSNENIIYIRFPNHSVSSFFLSHHTSIKSTTYTHLCQMRISSTYCF